ncbi:MAG: DUF637 domain-containing protein [Proteobacteria bacterium]|nr:DUF637 domain-containing protein [Pseudomonadota bacterium]
MRKYFSRIIHFFVLISYCHLTMMPVWGALEDADFTVHVTRHISEQRTALAENLHIDIHFKDKKRTAFKGETSFRFVRPLFHMDHKSADISSYSETTKLFDGKCLTTAEKTFLSHVPQFKALSFSAAGALFIEGIKDTNHRYSFISEGEIFFKNTFLKEVYIQACGINILENAVLTHLSSYLYTSQGCFQIFPQGSLSVTLGEFKGGTFLNQGRLSSSEHQRLDFQGTSFFNEGELSSEFNVDLQNISRFENHGTLDAPSLKIRGKSLFNLHKILGTSQSLLAYDSFSNEGEITGDSLKVVSLGSFYNAGKLKGDQFQQVVSQRDFLNTVTGVFSSAQLQMTSFGHFINLGEIKGNQGTLVAHLHLKNRGRLLGNLKSTSLLSFSNEGEIRGENLSLKAPHTEFKGSSNVTSENFHLEAEQTDLSGSFKAKEFIGDIEQRLNVLENTFFDVENWTLKGQGTCSYQTSHTTLSTLTFKTFGNFINEGLLAAGTSIEGDCAHITNLRTLETSRFKLILQTLKNGGHFKGGGTIALEVGENATVFGSETLFLEVEREFQNRGDILFQSLSGRGRFQNLGNIKGTGTKESPVLLSIQAFENGKETSEIEGRISIHALRILASCFLKFSELSFLHVPFLKVETALPLSNEGEIESHDFYVEGDFLNKGQIETKGLSVSRLFTNQGTVDCFETSDLQFEEVKNEGSIEGDSWTLQAQKFHNNSLVRAHQRGNLITDFFSDTTQSVIESEDDLRIFCKYGFTQHGIFQSDQKLEMGSEEDVLNEGIMVSSDLSLKVRKVQNKGTIKGRQVSSIETSQGLITLEGGSSFLNHLRYRTTDPSIFENHGSLTLSNLESMEGIMGFFNGKTGKLWIENAELKLLGNFENEGYVSLGRGTYEILGKIILGKEACLVAPHKEEDREEILEAAQTLREPFQEARFSSGGMRLFAKSFENEGRIETSDSLKLFTQKALCGLFKVQKTLYVHAQEAVEFILKNHPLLRAQRIVVETERFFLTAPLTLKSFLEVRAREFFNETEMTIPDLVVHALTFRNGESPQKRGVITSGSDVKVYAENIQNEFGHLFGKGDGLFMSSESKGDMKVGRQDQFKGKMTFGGALTIRSKGFANGWGEIFSGHKMSIFCSEDFENSHTESFLATNSDFEILVRNITNRFGQFCANGEILFKAEQTFMNHSGLIFGSQDALIEANDFLNTRTKQTVDVFIANPQSNYRDSHWKTLKYAAAAIQVQGVLRIHARNSGINLASHLFGGLGIHERGIKVEDTNVEEELHAKVVTYEKKKRWSRAKTRENVSNPRKVDSRVVLATRSSSQEIRTISDFAAVTGVVSAPLVVYEGQDLQVGYINPTVRLQGTLSPQRRLNLWEMLDPSLTQGFFTRGDRERRSFIGTRFSFGEESALPAMTFVTSDLRVQRGIQSSEIVPLFDQTTFGIASVQAFTKSFNRGYMTPRLSTLHQIKLLMENARTWEEAEKRKEAQRHITELEEEERSEAERIDALKEPMIVFVEETIENQAVAVPHILVPQRNFHPLLRGQEGVVFADERLDIKESSSVTITGTAAAQEHVRIKAPKTLLLKNFISETHREERGKGKKKTTTITTTHHAQPGGNLLSGGLLEVDSKTVVQGGTIAAQTGIFDGPLLQISSLVLKNTQTTNETTRKGLGAKGHQTTQVEMPAVGRAFLAVLDLHINTEKALIEGTDVHAEQIHNRTEQGLSFGPTVDEMRHSSTQSQRSVMGHVRTETRGGQEIEIPTTLNVGVIFSPESSLSLTNVQWDKMRTEIQGNYEENFRYLNSWTQTHTSGKLINPGIAAIVSLAVSFVTANPGASLAASMGFKGATLSAVVGSAMVQGAFTGICSQASLSLLANGGNPKETLRDLTSRSQILNLATTVIGAGLTAGVAHEMGINTLPGEKSFGEHLQASALRSTVTGALNVVVQKEDFKDAFITALKSTAVHTIGGYGANKISAFKENLGPVFHKMAHGILGAVTGRMIDKDGALGGALGAAIAEIIACNLAPSTEDLTEDIRNETKRDGKSLTDHEIQEKINDHYRSLSFASRLGASLVTLLAGENVPVALETATTAVENNFLTNLPQVQEQSKELWTAYDLEEAYAEGGLDKALQILMQKGLLVRDSKTQGYKVLQKTKNGKLREIQCKSKTEAWKAALETHNILNEVMERHETKIKQERYLQDKEEREKRAQTVDLTPKKTIVIRPLPLKKGGGISTPQKKYAEKEIEKSLSKQGTQRAPQKKALAVPEGLHQRVAAALDPRGAIAQSLGTSVERASHSLQSVSEIFTESLQVDLRDSTQRFENFKAETERMRRGVLFQELQDFGLQNEAALHREVSQFFGHFHENANGRDSHLTFVEDVLEGFLRPPTPPSQDTFLERNLHHLQQTIESTKTGAHVFHTGRQGLTWMGDKALKANTWAQEFHESGYEWEKFSTKNFLRYTFFSSLETIGTALNYGTAYARRELRALGVPAPIAQDMVSAIEISAGIFGAFGVVKGIGTTGARVVSSVSKVAATKTRSLTKVPLWDLQKSKYIEQVSAEALGVELESNSIPSLKSIETSFVPPLSKGESLAPLADAESVLAFAERMGESSILEGGFPILGKEDVVIPFGKGIKRQGMAWEDHLEHCLPQGSRLTPNFRTFDFDPSLEGKIGISGKTLDTMTPSRRANPNKIYYTLKRAIDAAADFTEYALGESELTSTELIIRQLEVGIPSNTISAQFEPIKRALQYAKERGIVLNVTKGRPK